MPETYYPGQGRNAYSMYIRDTNGERYFGDYPTRTRAALDAARLTTGNFLSIALENNEDERYWSWEQPGNDIPQWVEVDLEEDEDE